MITFLDVTKNYPLKQSQVPAICGVNLEVSPGEFVIITGRSGSGKTTLLNLAAGLTRPTSGKVLLDGEEIWKLPDVEQSRVRNQKIGFIFQFPSLLPSLNVLENVLLPGLFAGKGSKQDSRARALSLLHEVGLSDKLKALPRQLSAGQQQRVVIARALLHQPELLLADEPTSNLDEQTEHEVMGLFKAIHQSRGITILLVTHSNELVSYGTRALKMVQGAFAN